MRVQMPLITAPQSKLAVFAKGKPSQSTQEVRKHQREQAYGSLVLGGAVILLWIGLVMAMNASHNHLRPVFITLGGVITLGLIYAYYDTVHQSLEEDEESAQRLLTQDGSRKESEKEEIARLQKEIERWRREGKDNERYRREETSETRRLAQLEEDIDRLRKQEKESYQKTQELQREKDRLSDRLSKEEKEKRSLMDRARDWNRDWWTREPPRDSDASASRSSSTNARHSEEDRDRGRQTPRQPEYREYEGYLEKKDRLGRWHRVKAESRNSPEEREVEIGGGRFMRFRKDRNDVYRRDDRH